MLDNDGGKVGAILFTMIATFFGSKALHASEALAFSIMAVTTIAVAWWALRQ